MSKTHHVLVQKINLIILASIMNVRLALLSFPYCTGDTRLPAWLSWTMRPWEAAWRSRWKLIRPGDSVRKRAVIIGTDLDWWQSRRVIKRWQSWTSSRTWPSTRRRRRRRAPWRLRWWWSRPRSPRGTGQGQHLPSGTLRTSRRGKR